MLCLDSTSIRTSRQLPKLHAHAGLWTCVLGRRILVLLLGPSSLVLPCATSWSAPASSAAASELLAKHCSIHPWTLLQARSFWNLKPPFIAKPKGIPKYFSLRASMHFKNILGFPSQALTTPLSKMNWWFFHVYLLARSLMIIVQNLLHLLSTLPSALENSTSAKSRWLRATLIDMLSMLSRLFLHF